MRQAFEGVVGASLISNELILPADLAKPRGDLIVARVARDLGKSPLKQDPALEKNRAQSLRSGSKGKLTNSPPEETVTVR